MIDNAAACVFDPFASKKVNKHGYNLVSHARQNRVPAGFYSARPGGRIRRIPIARWSSRRSTGSDNAGEALSPVKSSTVTFRRHPTDI
jgi:hypothetical protein